MFVKVTTTIETTIALATMTPSHSVDISCGDPVPEDVVVAVATGALRSALQSIEGTPDDGGD